MHDARIGRHRAKIGERLLAPLQERVPFAIALELEIGVLRKRVVRAEVVDLHRVIDDQLDGLQRIDLLRIAAHRGHRIAHRGEIDDARNAGKILEQHARRTKRDLFLVALGWIPTRERFDVGFPYRTAVFESQQVFE